MANVNTHVYSKIAKWRNVMQVRNEKPHVRHRDRFESCIAQECLPFGRVARLLYLVQKTFIQSQVSCKELSREDLGILMHSEMMYGKTIRRLL
jgi:hypothetical protein